MDDLINYKDGSWYNGPVKDKKRHGQGTMYYADGNIYYGQWFSNRRSGKGTLYYRKSSIERYEGGWFDDKKHGKGTVYYNDGRKFEGKWFANIGEGICTDSDGKISIKHWNNDKEISALNAKLLKFKFVMLSSLIAIMMLFLTLYKISVKNSTFKSIIVLILLAYFILKLY